MQLVTYHTPAGPGVGRLSNGQVYALGFSDMTAFLSLPDWRERAEAATGTEPAAVLTDVKLLAPVPRPGKFIGIGLNYSDHAAETGLPLPKQPVLFAKFANAVTGPNDPIPHPGEAITSKLDWEVELGVVLGRTCRQVNEAEALSYVAGYTVINDVSARDLQFFDGQWLKGKALDGFAPMGPCLVTTDEIPDPQNLALTMQINGHLVQNGNTANMIFSVAAVISFLSQLMTLEPGDVVATGTPAGVGSGMKPPVFLRVGDVCRAEIPGIGVIENRVLPR
jgi:2-keto-4-pentenoate hydratase/2-oxohepta-3-ene-1,7-dioic acid hydratase in catechol pathway